MCLVTLEPFCGGSGFNVWIKNRLDAWHHTGIACSFKRFRHDGTVSASTLEIRHIIFSYDFRCVPTLVHMGALVGKHFIFS